MSSGKMTLFWTLNAAQSAIWSCVTPRLEAKPKMVNFLEQTTLKTADLRVHFRQPMNVLVKWCDFRALVRAQNGPFSEGKRLQTTDLRVNFLTTTKCFGEVVRIYMDMDPEHIFFN